MNEATHLTIPLFIPSHCSNKIVLVRVDLNVPHQDGVVHDISRMERILPTLQSLIKSAAKIVLLSHLGRPKGKVEPSLSLRVLIPSLSKVLNQPVSFVDDVIGTKAKDAIKSLKPGQVLMLENLRFYSEEEKDDPSFAKELAALGDIYINDAFAVSHRPHASVHAITQYIPSYAGLLLNNEMSALSHAFLSPKRPIMAIIGGAKVSTKLDLLKNLVSKVDYLVVGGGIANTFLFAAGYAIGDSLSEKDITSLVDEIQAAAKKAQCEILIPKDAKVAIEPTPTANVREVKLSDIAEDEKILDIGSHTVEIIDQALRRCQTVVWNGPLGLFEMPPFDQGTNAVATLIAHKHHNHLYSLAGGGETVAALNKNETAAQFSYLSTGGGAFLEFLEGKQLPGIQALMQQKEDNCQQDHGHSLMKNG